uniref:Uncharacterized protein n=1 Tax=Arundo donax TaxID=35708 RepID=A0A0A8YPI7_ARUDO
MLIIYFPSGFFPFTFAHGITLSTFCSGQDIPLLINICSGDNTVHVNFAGSCTSSEPERLTC